MRTELSDYSTRRLGLMPSATNSTITDHLPRSSCLSILTVEVPQLSLCHIRGHAATTRDFNSSGNSSGNSSLRHAHG